LFGSSISSPYLCTGIASTYSSNFAYVYNHPLSGLHYNSHCSITQCNERGSDLPKRKREVIYFNLKIEKSSKKKFTFLFYFQCLNQHKIMANATCRPPSQVVNRG
jgi:hypothetical protein